MAIHVIKLSSLSFLVYISVSEAELFFCEAQNRSFFSQTEIKSLNQKATINTNISCSFLFIYLYIQLYFCNNHAYIHLYYIYTHIHIYVYTDLSKCIIFPNTHLYIQTYSQNLISNTLLLKTVDDKIKTYSQL